MTFAIRDFNPATDMSALAELETLWESAPVTEEELRNQDAHWMPGSIRCRFVATSPDGAICGYAEAGKRAHVQTGRFRLWAIVAKEKRGQGVGTALYSKVHDFAIANQATLLKSQVKDNDPEALQFAEERGFKIAGHNFESVLDIGAFDGSRFSNVIEKIEAGGIRFFTFADTDGSEEAQRKLYDINTITAMDVPGHEQDSARPFEQFAADVIGGYWFRPEGQIFAADGDEIVGLGAVGIIRPGVGYNLMTGVLREYRGRGIALALKLQCIEFCKKYNLQSIRTHNDSQNQPILAINRKLGYTSEPGWLKLHCNLK